MSKTGSFNYLNTQIYNKTKEINLSKDIVLKKSENTIFDYNNGIEINYDNVVINGNGHYIDAKDSKRIFHVTGKDVVIKNLTLKNGNAEYGGAIRNNKGQCTLINCEFDNNFAREEGNDISNAPGSYLKIINCNFLQKNSNSILNYGTICINSNQKDELEPIITGNIKIIEDDENNNPVAKVTDGEEKTDTDLTNCPPISEEKPYFFISYSPLDGDKVFSEIKKFQEIGCNIWYDKEKRSEKEYEKEIFNNLLNSSLVIAFITSASVQDTNVQKEISYTIKKDKPLLPIYLEDFDTIEMNEDLDNDLSYISGIQKTRYTKKEYIYEFIKTLKLNKIDGWETVQNNFKYILKNYSHPYNFHQESIQKYQNENTTTDTTVILEDMDDNNLDEKSKPYIFISYKHNEKSIALPIINQLHDAGFNIWYDNGLCRGKMYDTTIANRITNCQLFISIISKEVINSSNNYLMIKELRKAKAKKKKVLPIFIDDIEFESNYLIQLLRTLSINKFEFNNENEFIKYCIKAIKDFGFQPNY